MVDLAKCGFIVRGGATIPGKWGAITATWPLATLSTDSSGVRVSFNPRWLRKFAAILAGEISKTHGEDSASWTVSWTELERTICSQRSVVMYPNSGRPCRFVTLNSRALIPLRELLAQHNIPVQLAITTAGKGFNI